MNDNNASSVKSRRKNKGKATETCFLGLPFIAKNPHKISSLCWNLPATGGYLVGCNIGQGMALAYLKFLRKADKISACTSLPLVTRSLFTRIQEEGGFDFFDFPVDFKTEQMDSLHGQFIGFMSTLTEWLQIAAQSSGEDLDNVNIQSWMYSVNKTACEATK